MAEFEGIEKVLHLRIFTHNIKIRKFMISCCQHVVLTRFSQAACIFLGPTVGAFFLHILVHKLS